MFRRGERVIRLARPALVILLAATLLVLTSAGASAHSHFNPTKAVDNLAWIILLLSIAVGGFVFVFLFVTLWRYREKSGRERGVPKTEDRTIEIIWTAVPAVIVLVLAVLSAQTLLALDEPPTSAVHIEVIGHQWFWEFRYPDGTTDIGELWVEEGQTVVLEVSSNDVIHSFFLSDFNFKIDAFPNRVTTTWFVAQPTGNYSIACAEFCGVAHAQMRGTLVVFEPEEGRPPYGPPAVDEPPGPGPEGEEVVDIELVEFSISPSELTLDRGQPVSLRIWNNGTMVHNLRIGAPFELFSGNIPNGTFALLNFTPQQNTAGADFYCDITGHKEAGMEGTLAVTGPVEIEVELYQWGIEPPQLEFQPGDEVRLRITNSGDLPHNLKLGPPYDIISETIDKDEVTWLNFTASSSADYWCDIPGHRESGMVGRLTGEADTPVRPPDQMDMSPLAIVIAILAIIAFVATIAAALRPTGGEKDRE